MIDPANSSEERYGRFLGLLQAAQGLDGDELRLFLDAQCGDDRSLRAEIERHLSLKEQAARLASQTGPILQVVGDSSSAVPPGPSLGSRIGPYRLLEILGEGGMGIVYLAEQTEPVQRRVALKLIKVGMDTKEVTARFQAERQALAIMQHPNIASVFDAGATESGRPYFVMEHVAGEPITRYCDRHRLDTRQRLALFVTVCDAVQHAHQKAIIHRDIKPSNLLVMLRDGKPVPKVIDFGIAKALDRRLTGDTLFTVKGQLVGTPEYMSPEQAEMGSLGVDTRTDIYSLGVVLYELLAGALPFDSKVLREAGLATIPKILREQEPAMPSTRVSRLGEASAEVAAKRATDVQSLARQLRGDLDWVVMKAMAKDPARRYASASELASDILRHLGHEPVLARPPSAVYRLGKLLKRRKVPVAVAAGVVLLLVAFAVGSSVAREMRIRERSEKARAALAEGDLESAKAEARVLEVDYPRLPETYEIRAEVRSAERRSEIEKAQALRLEGERLWKQHRDVKENVRELETAWIDERDRPPFWRPVWERGEEVERWNTLRSTRRDVEADYNRAVLTLHKALEIAPSDSEEHASIRRALAEAYFTRYKEAEAGDEVRLGPDWLRRMVEALAAGYEDELGGGGTVALQTDPPGAAVYWFRYEEREARLVPIPCRPALGGREPQEGWLHEDPFLQVERVWKPGLSTLLEGDRILEVNGTAVRSHGDLARSLRGVARDEEVEVKALRRGRDERFRWIPFPGTGTELELDELRLVHPYLQSGVTFSAYPLECTSDNRVGITAAGSSLEVGLPRGSYLFVFRKEGYEDTRVPLAMPWEGREVTVRLLKGEEIPPGFVYIPAGPARTGGDPEAFQSLDWGVRPLKGFFMSKHELTLGEWLEFLNDDEVRSRTDDKGKYAPAMSEEVRSELRAARGTETRPITLGTYLPRDATGRWAAPEGASLKLPAGEISYLAALEYIHWRNRKEERWRYRFPTDHEWERAARGVDRRIYVWGSIPVWNYCCSFLAKIEGGPDLVEAGASPFDESVFGVRDLAGSVSEHTDGRPASKLRNRAYRGGSSRDPDDLYFHVASRNSIAPWMAFLKSGLRLVVELGP
ncbi:MAG: protein kinase [Planctomycetes bacterium]|nr:protein kinase [Planctomycetota bacterium]